MSCSWPVAYKEPKTLPVHGLLEFPQRLVVGRDVADARSYAVSSFAKDMLDVSDNLSRAVGAVDPATLDGAPDAVKNLVEGVAMTEKALLSKMERHGVKKVDPQPGDAFDPHRHQAVAQIPSDQPNGRIASVMQTGFVIGERTLRAAMVAVSAGNPSGAPPRNGTRKDEAWRRDQTSFKSFKIYSSSIDGYDE